MRIFFLKKLTRQVLLCYTKGACENKRRFTETAAEIMTE